MARFSNITEYNSPDGLPANPWPVKITPTVCSHCYNTVMDQVCPHCGADVELNMEPDYSAGQREYDKYDE